MRLTNEEERVNEQDKQLLRDAAELYYSRGPGGDHRTHRGGFPKDDAELIACGDRLTAMASRPDERITHEVPEEAG